MLTPRLALVAVIVALVNLTGCGGVKTGTITGTVTHAGKKLNGGTITFFAKDSDEKTQVSFPISEDGSYTATLVPYGELQVSVTPPPPPIILPTAGEGPARTGGGKAASVKQSMGQFTENGLEVPADISMAIDRINPIAPTGPAFPPEYMDPVSSPLLFKLDTANAEYEVVIP